MSKFVEAPLEDWLKATKDAARWRFLLKHWNSTYKGKPLWRYIEEDALVAGGTEAIIDAAMRLSASHD